MPELPEVETIVREMEASALKGTKIDKAVIYWDRTIAGLHPDLFCQRIRHQSIVDIQRRGKFIVIRLTKDTLLIHLRMTGKFLITTDHTTTHAHERVRLYLSDGRILRYEDQRKFGKWYLTDKPEDLLAKVGIEPLSSTFTLKAFKKLLERRQRQIKPFLLDQRYVAGLGNIYVDEALWAAKIHPTRTAASLSTTEIAALHQAIILVLQAGVKNTGTSLGAARANYFSISGQRGSHQAELKVFRKDGCPCPRCHTILEKIVLGQRGTHFCPRCQKTFQD